MTAITSLLPYYHYKMCLALRWCISLIIFVLRSVLFQVSKILQMQFSFIQHNWYEVGLYICHSSPALKLYLCVWGEQRGFQRADVPVVCSS